MQLPKIENVEKYVGLFVVDFGDHSGVGFTAQEVAELLESSRYSDIKVYKIHRAMPDETIELRGVRNEIFQLESGMFFYAQSLDTARRDFKELVAVAVKKAPPCRAKVQLAQYSDNNYVTALLYPAEYEDEVGVWLIKNHYMTSGAAEGGIGAADRYYKQAPEVIERHQLFGESSVPSRTGEELLAGLGKAVQR